MNVHQNAGLTMELSKNFGANLATSDYEDDVVTIMLNFTY